MNDSLFKRFILLATDEQLKAFLSRLPCESCDTNDCLMFEYLTNETHFSSQEERDRVP